MQTEHSNDKQTHAHIHTRPHTHAHGHLHVRTNLGKIFHSQQKQNFHTRQNCTCIHTWAKLLYKHVKLLLIEKTWARISLWVAKQSPPETAASYKNIKKKKNLGKNIYNIPGQEYLCGWQTPPETAASRIHTSLHAGGRKKNQITHSKTRLPNTHESVSRENNTKLTHSKNPTLGFRVQGLRIGVWGSGFRLRIWGLGRPSKFVSRV